VLVGRIGQRARGAVDLGVAIGASWRDALERARHWWLFWSNVSKGKGFQQSDVLFLLLAQGCVPGGPRSAARRWHRPEIEGGR